VAPYDFFDPIDRWVMGYAFEWICYKNYFCDKFIEKIKINF
jgi:hypothetical protein